MENTQENNKLIAEFMGFKVNEAGQVLRYVDIKEGLKFQRGQKIHGWQMEYHLSKLQYHCSWDWLMPVVEKIESVSLVRQIDRNEGLEDWEPDVREEEWQFSVEIVNSQCMINQDVLPQYYGTDQDFLKTYDCRNEGKISKLEATYKAVVEFIKWYNANKS